MKIDFAAVILGLDGTAIKEGDKPLSLGTVACQALTAQFADEPQLAADIKVKRFRMALVAATEQPHELPVDDVAELKRLIGKAYGPLIVGRAYEIIEPAAATTE